jgi:ferredoxin
MREARPHDVLCVGAPVYEKHLEFYMQQVLRYLPEPDATWGQWAFPFVTYGGISTGKALAEARTLLRKKKRKVIGAMKIEASHIATPRLVTRVNEGLPGRETKPFIAEAVARINQLAQGTITGEADFGAQLAKHTFKEWLLSTLMNERMLHKYKYPGFKALEDKCTRCLKCVKACAVQRIGVENGRPVFMQQPECIHCFSCANSCKTGAVTFIRDEADWAEIERIYSKVSAPGSFFRSMEEPRCAVYPLSAE